ncbi:MAG: hypothetical protein ABI921_10235, partial [Panacibacter sp.]
MKHKLLFIFFITGCIKVFAQPVIKQQTTVGGSSSDVLYATTLTSDGGVLAGGYSASKKSGDKSQGGKGATDYWIVKLDKKGRKEWDKTIGGSSDDIISSVAQTSDGGYILGGSSLSGISGDKTEANRGMYDYWIVKLDSQRNMEWNKTIGGAYGDNLTTIEQTSDGGYIIFGGSSSNISGEKTDNSRGGADFWLVKITASGVIEWDKTIGGNDADYSYAFEKTADGGYLLGGSSESNISGEKTANSKGQADFWLVKVDAFGNSVWDKTIGGNSSDEMLSFKQTIDGGYILGGSSYSRISGDKTSYNRGFQDYWVVKLDSS